MSRRSRRSRKKQKQVQARQRPLDEILGPPEAPESEEPPPPPECPLCDGSSLDDGRRCPSCGSVVHDGPQPDGNEVTLRGEVLRADGPARGALTLRLRNGLAVQVQLDDQTRILHRRFVRPARAMRPGDEVLAAGQVGIHFDEHHGGLREASVQSYSLEARLLSVGPGRERLLELALRPEREQKQVRRRIEQALERFRETPWVILVYLFPFLCFVTCVWTPACPLVCSHGPLDEALRRANSCTLVTDRLGPDVGWALYGCSNVHLACACEERAQSRASLPISGDWARGSLSFSYNERSDRLTRATVRAGHELIDALRCRVVHRYSADPKR